MTWRVNLLFPAGVTRAECVGAGARSLIVAAVVKAVIPTAAGSADSRRR